MPAPGAVPLYKAQALSVRAVGDSGKSATGSSD
jgi:hypothetical protein